MEMRADAPVFTPKASTASPIETHKSTNNAVINNDGTIQTKNQQQKGVATRKISDKQKRRQQAQKRRKHHLQGEPQKAPQKNLDCKKSNRSSNVEKHHTSDKQNGQTSGQRRIESNQGNKSEVKKNNQKRGKNNNTRNEPKNGTKSKHPRRRRKKQSDTSAKSTVVENNLDSFPSLAEEHFPIIDNRNDKQQQQNDEYHCDKPHLGQQTLTPINKGSSDSNKPCWSMITKTAHEKVNIMEMKQKEKEKKRRQEIETYTNLQVLSNKDDTIETSGERNKEDLNNAPTSHENDNAASSASSLQNNYRELKQSVNFCKVVNIEKLRSRWQAILKEKEARDIISAAANAIAGTMEGDDDCNLDEQSISSNSSSSTSSSSETSDSSTESITLTSNNTPLHTSYLGKPYPMLHAIIENNANALAELTLLPIEISGSEKSIPVDEVIHEIESNGDNNTLHMIQMRIGACRNKMKKLSILQLAILLDKPHFLATILDGARMRREKNAKLLLDDVNEEGQNPLFLSCEYGLDACLQVLLSFSPKLSMKNSNGDSILHYACRKGDLLSVQHILLLLPHHGKNGRTFDMTTIRKKDKSAFARERQRILCYRNHFNETPLHIVCKLGQTEIMDFILTACLPNVLHKALLLKDESGHTPFSAAILSEHIDIILHILTWRGNQQNLTANENDVNKQSSCPLTLAVSTGNVDLVKTLIGSENLSAFSNDIVPSYHFNDALCEALLSIHDSENALFIVEDLIEGGADPHQGCKTSVFDKQSGESYYGKSPLFIATCRGQVDLVFHMLHTSERVMKNKQETRKRDLKLQNKPSSYFELLEASESQLTCQSIKEILVQSLLLASKQTDKNDERHATSNHLSIALALMKRGHNLSQESMGQLIALMNDDENTTSVLQFKASNSQPVVTTALLKNEMNLVKNYDQIYCKWVKHKDSKFLEELKDTHENEECFIITKGQRILCNKSIFTNKCHKLEAAIHFAEMKSDERNDDDERIEVHLDANFDFIKLLVIHCYHGSILGGLLPSYSDCCQQLLDLYIFADEYLCPSLCLECEMRLLSNNPYACYCRKCTLGNTPYQPRPKSRNSSVYSYGVKSRTKLITPKMILKVLAFAQDADDFYSDSNKYQIVMTNHHSGNTRTFGPLAAVRLICWRELLLNFNKVIKSDSFLELTHSMMLENHDDGNGCSKKFEDYVAVYLMETCLGEIQAFERC